MELLAIARKVALELAHRQQKLVLAESCTGGLLAATLAAIPGISAHFCGSSVVYREQTKHQWLGVPLATLETWSAVSAPSSTAIARGVLERTPEATISLGITGHLGPEAPPSSDGQVFVAIWGRGDDAMRELASSAQQLVSRNREERQRESCEIAFQFLLAQLGASGE